MPFLKAFTIFFCVTGLTQKKTADSWVVGTSELPEKTCNFVSDRSEWLIYMYLKNLRIIYLVVKDKRDGEWVMNLILSENST